MKEALRASTLGAVSLLAAATILTAAAPSRHPRRSHLPEHRSAVPIVALSSPAGAPAPADPASESGAFTAPLPGLTADELARFEAGKAAFQTEEGVADGLGAIFNGPSSTPFVACASCHDQGGTGGGSDFLETRFGRQLPGGGFDPLAQLGGSLLQEFAIPGVTPEKVPEEANVTALRRTTPLFGLGLVDAVPDQTFEALATACRSSGTATEQFLKTDG